MSAAESRRRYAVAVVAPHSHSIILSHGNALIYRHKLLPRTTKNRLADPSEISALDSKANFDDPRFARFQRLSASIGRFFSDGRRPSRTGNSQKRPSRGGLPPESVGRFTSGVRRRYSGTPETAPSATCRASPIPNARRRALPSLFAQSVSGARAKIFEDGDTLYQECSAEMGQIEYSSCKGYVAGVSDAMSEGNSIGGYTACFPSYFKVGQAQDAVKQFLTSHPQWRHHAAAGLVAEALAEAFPCK